MINLYAIRHAESIGNRDNKLVWHTDVELSEKWILQRNALCTYMQSLSLKIDQIFSSDLVRARDTILPYSQFAWMEIVEDERLREMFFGEYENLDFSEIDMEPFYKDKYGYTAPNGESYRAMKSRVEEFLKEQILPRNEGNVLVSTHACVIRVLDGILLWTPPNEIVELEVGNASVSHYRISDQWVDQIRFACESHFKKAA